MWQAVLRAPLLAGVLRAERLGLQSCAQQQSQALGRHGPPRRTAESGQASLLAETGRPRVTPQVRLPTDSEEDWLSGNALLF